MTTAALEAYVRSRFDSLEARFRSDVAPDDYRLAAIRRALGSPHGMVVLDLGCGKGRFARHLAREGANVVGLDSSRAMLDAAVGLRRVQASASRLPFADDSFDAVTTVEVLEHVACPRSVLAESARILQPGGTLLVIDKNLGALDARRPWLPAAAVKWVDECRGRWMYPRAGPFRERWFWPAELARELFRFFDEVQVEHLISPEESRRAVFRSWPGVCLMTAWIARRKRGGHG